MKLASNLLLSALVASSANGFAFGPQSRPATSRFSTTEESVVEETKLENPIRVAPMPTVDEALQAKEEEDQEVRAKAAEQQRFAAEAAAASPSPSPKKEQPRDVIRPGRYDGKSNSIAVPFLKRPVLLDGSHAGDYGFDPFGLSEQFDLYTMQESEIRHGRLAMLAVIGWPLSELVAPDWMLQANGCAPSVLNGFNPLSFLSVVTIFGALGYFEFKTALRTTWDTKLGKIHEDDMQLIWKYGVAGDYNFDPLNLYNKIGDNAISRKGMRDVEIGHGRMAMLGITYFAAWEFLTGHPITANSIFFSPNPIFPALVLAYTAFNVFYEVKRDDQYLVRLEETSEGQALKERLLMEARNFKDNNRETWKFLLEAADPEPKIKMLAPAAESLKKAYDQMESGYLDYSTSNIRNKQD